MRRNISVAGSCAEIVKTSFIAINPEYNFKKKG
jgi:hypothetical protein